MWGRKKAEESVGTVVYLRAGGGDKKRYVVQTYDPVYRRWEGNLAFDDLSEATKFADYAAPDSSTKKVRVVDRGES